MSRQGSLIILSGPSGAGKSSIAAEVLKGLSGLRFSVSYTTRAPRGGERDGVEYRFVSRDDFEALIRRHDLLEWAVVHGNYYGTSRRDVEEALKAGEDVLLDVDVQGAQVVRNECREAVGIFIMPPSYEVLRRRLKERKLDADKVVERRLAIARKEIAHYKNYDYLIVNENLEESARQLKAIILGARRRLIANAGHAESIVCTFGGTDAEDPR